MPYGFVGNASQEYLTNVNDSLSNAQAVHNKDPLAGCSNSAAPAPTLPGRSNRNAPYSPDGAMSGGYVTGVGDHTNVVVDQNTYDEIIQKIRRTDTEIAESLHQIATQIEEMCETIYIVPETLPKYLAVVDKVKASLDEFQSLADQAVMQTYEFINDMMQVNGR